MTHGLEEFCLHTVTRFGTFTFLSHFFIRQNQRLLRCLQSFRQQVLIKPPDKENQKQDYEHNKSDAMITCLKLCLFYLQFIHFKQRTHLGQLLIRLFYMITFHQTGVLPKSVKSFFVMLFPSGNQVNLLRQQLCPTVRIGRIRLFQQFIDGPHGKVILCRIKIVTESGRQKPLFILFRRLDLIIFLHPGINFISPFPAYDISEVKKLAINTHTQGFTTTGADISASLIERQFKLIVIELFRLFQGLHRFSGFLSFSFRTVYEFDTGQIIPIELITDLERQTADQMVNVLQMNNAVF